MNKLYLPAVLICFGQTSASIAGDETSGKKIQDQPNIVFILADDMGWAQPGFNGGNQALTPNLDRLAKQSLSLTQFYTHSVCAPTRGAFLTGRYAFRNWMDWRIRRFWKTELPEKIGTDAGPQRARRTDTTHSRSGYQ